MLSKISWTNIALLGGGRGTQTSDVNWCYLHLVRSACNPCFQRHHGVECSFMVWQRCINQIVFKPYFRWAKSVLEVWYGIQRSGCTNARHSINLFFICVLTIYFLFFASNKAVSWHNHFILSFQSQLSHSRKLFRDYSTEEKKTLFSIIRFIIKILPKIMKLVAGMGTIYNMKIHRVAYIIETSQINWSKFRNAELNRQLFIYGQ